MWIWMYKLCDKDPVQTGYFVICLLLPLRFSFIDTFIKKLKSYKQFKNTHENQGEKRGSILNSLCIILRNIYHYSHCQKQLLLLWHPIDLSLLYLKMYWF